MRKGFSLLELLLVLAVLGLVLALGLPRLNPDAQAVNQATRGLAEQVVRARLEAIRQNAFVGLLLDPSLGAGGGYAVFIDEDADGSLDAGERVLQEVRFGQGDWGRVRLSAPQSPTVLPFDPRGIPQGFAGTAVRLQNRAGTYTRELRVSPQGRVL
ncbi:GspH/FimT family protein [Thermus sp.]|uniref:GspH/FimT family protein n=1 Tax=Thermus sp. TaxID=275 RepID=UPI00307EB8E3